VGPVEIVVIVTAAAVSAAIRWRWRRYVRRQLAAIQRDLRQLRRDDWR